MYFQTVVRYRDNAVSGNSTLTLAICQFLVFSIFMGNLMETCIGIQKLAAV